VNDLPLTIPLIKNIHATDNGCSPLDNLKQWVNITKDGKKYRRETNTMPQWAGSC
jgi:leucyl-tRNA synthetase